MRSASSRRPPGLEELEPPVTNVVSAVPQFGRTATPTRFAIGLESVMRRCALFDETEPWRRSQLATHPKRVVTATAGGTALHKPPTPAQWVFFTMTGAAYGWMRAGSGSTTAAALMHAVYNVTLFLSQLFVPS